MRRVIFFLMSALAIAGTVLFVRARSPDPAAVRADPLETAWQAVHARPEKPSTWVRLGEVQAALDQVEAAEHAFRAAIRLGDDSGLAYARLGFLVYGQGRDAEAQALLLEARRRGAGVPMLEFTLEQLAEATDRELASPSVRGGSPSVRLGSSAGAEDPTAAGAGQPPTAGAEDPSEVDAGQPPAVGAGQPAAAGAGQPAAAGAGSPWATDAGATDAGGPSSDAAAPWASVEPAPASGSECELPLRRHGRGVFLLDLAVGGAAATLVVDTGASITVLTEELVAELGFLLDSERSIQAITANGPVRMPTSVVGPFAVGDAAVAEVRVAVCADCVQGFADGLLGLDLQAAFQMELDLARQRVRVCRSRDPRSP